MCTYSCPCRFFSFNSNNYNPQSPVKYVLHSRAVNPPFHFNFKLFLSPGRSRSDNCSRSHKGGASPLFFPAYIISACSPRQYQWYLNTSPSSGHRIGASTRCDTERLHIPRPPQPAKKKPNKRKHHRPPPSALYRHSSPRARPSTFFAPFPFPLSFMDLMDFPRFIRVTGAWCLSIPPSRSRLGSCGLCQERGNDESHAPRSRLDNRVLGWFLPPLVIPTRAD